MLTQKNPLASHAGKKVLQGAFGARFAHFEATELGLMRAMGLTAAHAALNPFMAAARAEIGGAQ